MPAKRRNIPKTPKPLVPTGSVDEVMLTGSTRGQSLTLFQSVGLMITGLGVALGVGAISIASEFHLEKTFNRNFGQLFGGGVFVLWGVAMIAFGILGVLKIVRKRK